MIDCTKLQPVISYAAIITEDFIQMDCIQILKKFS